MVKRLGWTGASQLSLGSHGVFFLGKGHNGLRAGLQSCCTFGASHKLCLCPLKAIWCDGMSVRMGVWGSRLEVKSQEGLMAGVYHLVTIAGVGGVIRYSTGLCQDQETIRKIS